MRIFALLALLAAPAFADGLSPAQQGAVDERIRAYLLENPEVILEALDVLEQRRAEQQAVDDARLIAQNAAALFEDARNPVFGPADATVTLVEFADYSCGYCKKAHPVIDALLETNDDLRVVVKQLPILGPGSVAAARVAIAAQRVDESKFAALHDALFAYRGKIDEAAALRLAAQAGYDADAVAAEIKSDAVASRINDNYMLSRALGVSGTPAFVLGDEVLRGFLPAAPLQKLIDATRAQKS